MLLRALARDDEEELATYEPAALERVWRAQNFSSWMTQMLHRAPGADGFDLRRQLGELDNVANTAAGQRYLAEQYTGWPSGR